MKKAGILGALVLAVLILSAANVSAQSRRLVPLNDPTCPIVIERLDAGYTKPFFAQGDWQSPFLDIFWKNKSDSKKTVRAAKFKAMIFNVLREHYRTENLITNHENLVPGKSNKDAWRWPSWVEEPEAYHFFVVCEKLLFDDGTIWVRSDDSLFLAVEKEMVPDVPLEVIIRAQERERESKQ